MTLRGRCRGDRCRFAGAYVPSQIDTGGGYADTRRFVQGCWANALDNFARLGQSHMDTVPADILADVAGTDLDPLVGVNVVAWLSGEALVGARCAHPMAGTDGVLNSRLPYWDCVCGASECRRRAARARPHASRNAPRSQAAWAPLADPASHHTRSRDRTARTHQPPSCRHRPATSPQQARGSATAPSAARALWAQATT